MDLSTTLVNSKTSTDLASKSEVLPSNIDMADKSSDKVLEQSSTTVVLQNVIKSSQTVKSSPSALPVGMQPTLTTSHHVDLTGDALNDAMYLHVQSSDVISNYVASESTLSLSLSSSQIMASSSSSSASSSVSFTEFQASTEEFPSSTMMFDGSLIKSAQDVSKIISETSQVVPYKTPFPADAKQSTLPSSGDLSATSEVVRFVSVTSSESDDSYATADLLSESSQLPLVYVKPEDAHISNDSHAKNESIYPSSTELWQVSHNLDQGEVIPTMSLAQSSVVDSNATGVLPPNNNNPSNPELTESFTVLLGVSLCAVGIFLLLITILIICCRRKKPSKKKPEEEIRSHDLWVTTTPTRIEPSSLDRLTPNKESFPQVFQADENQKRLRRESDIGKYRALYPYAACQTGHLTFNKGDVITVTNKANDEWWEGELGENQGWFPSSYVKEIVRKLSSTNSAVNHRKSDEVKIANGLDDVDFMQQPSPPMSSFLLNKDSRPRSVTFREHSDIDSPHMSNVNSNRSSRSSWAMGKEVPIPRVPGENEELTVAKSEEHFDSTVKNRNIAGLRFRVLYDYVATFKTELSLEEGEIVVALERDKNGWMRGEKMLTGAQGWFPAVYVEITNQGPEDFEIGKKIIQKEIYDHLYPNKNQHSEQDWICIEHVAICPYASEKPHDLSFGVGDTVLVLDTMENGWWMGSCGGEVGWFPGSYVQLVEELEDTKPSSPEYSHQDPTSSNPVSESTDRERHASFNDRLLSAASGSPHDVESPSTMSRLSTFTCSDKSVSPATSSQLLSDDDFSIGRCSTTSSVDSRRKIKPKRKAPKPPVPSDTDDPSKLPTPIKPTRPAPPSPGKSHSTPQHKVLIDVIGPAGDAKSTANASSSSDLTNSCIPITITPDQSFSSGQRPAVPKRFVKPKIIKIPRKNLNTHKAVAVNQGARSPPPPRPKPPKNLPEKYKKLASPPSTPEVPKKEDQPQTTPFNNSDILHDDQMQQEERPPSEGFTSLDNSHFLNDTSDLSVSLSHPPQKRFDTTEDTFDSSCPTHTAISGGLDYDTTHDSVDGGHPILSDDVFQEPIINSAAETSENQAVCQEMSPGTDTTTDTSQFTTANASLNSTYDRPDQKTCIENGETNTSVSSPRLSNHTQRNQSPPPVAPKPKGIPKPKIYSKPPENEDPSSVKLNETFTIESHSPKENKNQHNIDILQKDSQKKVVTGIPVGNRHANKARSSEASDLPTKPVFNSEENIRERPSKPPEIKKTSGIPVVGGAKSPPVNRKLKEPTKIINGKSGDKKAIPNKSNSKILNKKGTDPKRRLQEPRIHANQEPSNNYPESKITSNKQPSGSSRLPRLRSDSSSGKDDGTETKIASPKPARPPPTYSPDYCSDSKPLSKIAKPHFSSFGKKSGMLNKSSSDGTSPKKTSLKKAVKAYEGKTEDELSFGEGSFILEISKDDTNPGWFIGMLADGTKGSYHESYVEDSLHEQMDTAF